MHIALGDLKPEFVERLVEAVKAEGHDAYATYDAPHGYSLHACDHGTGAALAKIKLRQTPWDDDEEDEDDDYAD